VVAADQDGDLADERAGNADHGDGDAGSRDRERTVLEHVQRARALPLPDEHVAGFDLAQ
jgi:hypothetical protein